MLDHQTFHQVFDKTLYNHAPRDGSFRFGPERRAIGYLARIRRLFFTSSIRHR